MAGLSVLKDAVVYIDTISTLGKAKTITLPTVERTTADHETLGMPGTIRIGVGLEAMEATITWEGWNRELAVKAYNTYGFVDLQCRGVIEEMSGNVKTLTPCITYMKGTFRSTQGGEFSAKALATRESTLDLHYYKEEVAGRPTVEVDVANNVYKVDGIDLNSRRNQILGIV